MCYDVQAKMETQFRRAKLNNDNSEVERLRAMLKRFTDNPLYHAHGFTHPEMLIYTDLDPLVPTVSRWGLIPKWVKDEEQASKISRGTLNARGESIFEKPSFKESAIKRRCVIHIDGFFEHRHFDGKTSPYFIMRRDRQPMSLAGLWSEWINRDTGEIINSFSIVTTKANEMMSKIHNNPRLPEPRMPLVLEEEYEHEWLQDIYERDEFTGDLYPEKRLNRIKSMIEPYRYDDELVGYTVERLRGKSYLGNCKEVTDPVRYEELDEL